jgi:modification methylase
VIAKAMHRHWIGIEQQEAYVRLARERIAAVDPEAFDESIYLTHEPRRGPRVAFGRLVEQGLLPPGTHLYFRQDRSQKAVVRADGTLQLDGEQGSIHKLAKQLSGGPANGWTCWYFQQEDGELEKIDVLRQRFRKSQQQSED